MLLGFIIASFRFYFSVTMIVPNRCYLLLIFYRIKHATTACFLHNGLLEEQSSSPYNKVVSGLKLLFHLLCKSVAQFSGKRRVRAGEHRIRCSQISFLTILNNIDNPQLWSAHNNLQYGYSIPYS